MLKHIEKYLARGWYLIPLRDGAKIPSIGDWVNTASNDQVIVLGWLRRAPAMNLGVVCGAKSGFFAVDIDNKGERTGMDSLRRLQQSDRRLPETLTQITASGAMHMLYQADADFDPPSSKDFVPGIEVRGRGAQIVISPSVIGQGRYAWENFNVKIAAPPRWLVEQLTRKPRSISERARVHRFDRVSSDNRPLSRIEGAAAKVAGEREGNRNKLLNWATYVAGDAAAKGGIDPNYVAHRMYAAGRAAGLDHKETEATVNSGLRAANKEGK